MTWTRTPPISKGPWTWGMWIYKMDIFIFLASYLFGPLPYTTKNQDITPHHKTHTVELCVGKCMDF